MKRVFIVHGWGGYPEECWFPWLKKELEAKGFSVTVPQMPDTDTPRIEAWVKHLATSVGTPDKDTFFVGHSIGCQTILRYLETIRTQVGGAVFVGGWFRLNGLETAEEKAVAKPWLETPVNFAKIKKATTKFVAIFSDNDPYVPLDDAKRFEKELGAKTVIVKGKGHMGASDNCPQLKEALDAVLELSR